MYGVEVAGGRDSWRDPPLAAQIVQCPRRGAGLPVGLAVDGLLRAAAEDDEGHQRAEHDAQRDHHVAAEAAREDAEGRGGAHDQHERTDHVRQEPLVLFALNLEGLPQLAAALLGGRLAGSLGLGLGGLGLCGCAGFRHSYAPVMTE